VLNEDGLGKRPWERVFFFETGWERVWLQCSGTAQSAGDDAAQVLRAAASSGEAADRSSRIITVTILFMIKL
jgi:hypothetical protein